MGSTATATNKAKSKRTTVGLDDDSIKRVDSLIAQEVRKVREAGGIGVAPTRTQIVEALITRAHDTTNGAS